MPFNSAGVYTPTSGAEDAAPGDVIRSATWNAIFTDLSAALTLLGEQLYGTTTVTAATYAPLSADARILVNRAGTVNITLPTLASRGGYPLIVKDVSGAASTNIITLTPNGAETIEGLATATIAVDYGGYALLPVTGIGWIILP